jgi:hypothetical protein
MRKSNQVVIDSIKGGNAEVVTSLQKTIGDQAKELDSLSRLHAEKHLTPEDKKNILAQLASIGKLNDTTIHYAQYMIIYGSNGEVFLKELREWLNTKNIYQGRIDQYTARFEGYRIDYAGYGAVNIYIGSFDLSK